jgi:hypothetical protein
MKGKLISLQWSDQIYLLTKWSKSALSILVQILLKWYYILVKLYIIWIYRWGKINQKLSDMQNSFLFWQYWVWTQGFKLA